MPVTFDELVANNKRFEAEHPIRLSDLPPTELNHIDCASSFDKSERKFEYQQLSGTSSKFKINFLSSIISPYFHDKLNIKFDILLKDFQSI